MRSATTKVAVSRPRLPALARAVFVVGLISVALVSMLPLAVRDGVPYDDKAAHLVAGLCLALLGTLSFYRGLSILMLGISLILLGAFVEVLQGLVPSRSADLIDLLFGVVGVAAGIGLGWGVASLLGWPLRWRSPERPLESRSGSTSKAD